MKRLVILAGALLLSACSSATAIQNGIAQGQTVIPQVVKDTCAALSFADFAFKIAVPIAKISAEDVATEAVWMARVNDACAKAPADATAAMAFLSSAMAAINGGTNTGTVPAAPAVLPASAAPAS